MMAMARGEKSAAKAVPAKPTEKSTAKAKPAAKSKPAAKAAPAAKDTAPKDTASILAAARSAQRAGPMSKAEAAKLDPAAKPAKKQVIAPPMPEKPAYATPKPASAPVDEGRRIFVLSAVIGAIAGSAFAIGNTAMAVTFGLWTLGTARFMFPNVLREPPSQFKVGFPGNFSPGQVETKFKAQFGIWVVSTEYKGEQQLFALKSVCTHLGCTPNWLEAEQKFKCPCHGSGFYKDGINFEGPAPRPLERYAISIADDGQVLIDKSRLFQEEMGQWAESASYIPV
jgi:cytochrome b6-f complex iron-sulfur subunit